MTSAQNTPQLTAPQPTAPQHNKNFPHALLGARELDALPQGALLLNLARGGLVDEEALADRLRTGRLGGAALDVYAQEPYHGPLCGLDNTLLTPHCASYAREARARMEVEAARNLLDALASLGL